MTEQHELKTEPASVSGQAGRVAAQPAVLRATIEIVRAGTGKKEVFELIGTPVAEGERPQGE